MKKKFLIYLLFSTLLYGEKLHLLFEGNSKISSSELYSSLELYEPSFFEFYVDKPSIESSSIDLILQSIKDYYKTKGFFHADVSYLKDKSAIRVKVDEKSPIIVKNISDISDIKLDETIPFKVGDIFDADKFTQSKKDIKLLYANSNFCNASIDAKAWIDIELNEAHLKYESSKNKKCYFGRVKINASKDIDEEIIRSILYIDEYETFSVNKITRSYEELYSHEGVSKAVIETNVVNENIIDVNVEVVQNEKPLRFEFGIGASSDEGAMVSTGIMDRNFLGNLRVLSLKARVAEIKQNVKLNFDMPLAGRNFTGFETGYENEKFLGFKEYKFYSSAYLKQKRAEHTFGESILFDSIKTYDSEDELLFPPLRLFIISPKFEYGFDTRDKILEPTKGYFINGEASGSLMGALSDATYHKLRATAGYIHSLQNSIAAFKGTYGTLKLVDGDIPASYRFFAGGMHSNRGYGYRELGPTNAKGDPIGFDSILEFTAELRFKIYGNFRGVVFNDNSYLGESGSPNYGDGYNSVGFGFRYVTPIGPVGIDFGFDVENPTKQYAVHFHIGELF
ncbi:BamA/TamA family outer membrane protein [Sulfurimonas sp.]|uniref:autotransporter assembly complex protein TamA n=1 Tax=Sulfurimonas sp. TaxID=2022749 RepID=UPI0025D19B4E|nr:BamA/TamA family outer membrane protein [Sulfurimonas sp.]MBW6488866.1 BamA/TamA family outer membrane protein [Sulfurimonas sp.]